MKRNAKCSVNVKILHQVRDDWNTYLKFPNVNGALSSSICLTSAITA